MSRTECISNRNIKIIATYVSHKLGHHDRLFEGLSYPTERYDSPEDFFLNEDEWTTGKNFHAVLRKAKEMVGEPHFYFRCGASSARLRSWGRLDYFETLFTSPSDGFKRLPFFNENFNDTMEFNIIKPPFYDKSLGKIRTIIEVRYHSDVDLHKDYIGNPYLRGIIASIPTIWGLKPAVVKQPLNPYDPEILFNEEREFVQFNLDARMQGNLLTIKDPNTGQRRSVGKTVILEPESINGRKTYLGKYTFDDGVSGLSGDIAEGILITETIRMDGRILLRAGEIFKAPCSILDVRYDKLSLRDRISQLFRIRSHGERPAMGLIDTINQLRETIDARNTAYHELEETNRELVKARKALDDYARTLEKKVDERTTELREAQEKLLQFNRDLEAKVKDQVDKLKRYDELRRYFSPKLSEKILAAGNSISSTPQRKMMTVVFLDIRNFSSFTETLEPEELFQLLDTYLSEMTRIVHKYDGTLNKIIGDGMLVFFGDPIPMEDHARRAVMMAVDMQEKVSELRKEWQQYGHELGIGVGINTGYMTVGNIGSEIHKDYTVIGHPVNVAARLESFAKAGEILISQRTYNHVKDIVKADKIGEITVKGLHRRVVAYNVRQSR